MKMMEEPLRPLTVGNLMVDEKQTKEAELRIKKLKDKLF